MAVFKPLMFENGSNSLSDFLQELMDKHKNEETKYIAPLINVICDFEKYGSRINLHSSRTFPPYKTIKGTNFAELRTKECRYFIYHTGNDIWLGLHGYEKQGNETPRKEIKRAKKEIQTWKEVQIKK